MKRRILYFKEDPHPRDYINSLSNSEIASIDLKLETMAETEPYLWPWVAPVDGKLWRIRYGNHRLLYCLNEGDIVILHAVRKRGRRLDRNDVELAKARMDRVYDM